MKIIPQHLCLGDQIGGGGVAIVFAGTLERKDKIIHVAIKRLSNQFGAAEAVKKEVDILGRVRHRNIVECYGAVFDPKAVDRNSIFLGYCIVLELCTISLSDAIEMHLQGSSIGEISDGGRRVYADDKINIISKIALPDVQEKVPCLFDCVHHSIDHIIMPMIISADI